MKKYVVTILILLVVFSALNIIGVTGVIKNFSYNLLDSTQKIIWQEGSKKLNLAKSFFEFSQPYNEIENLKKKNNALQAELAKLKSIKKENKDLKKALDIELEKEHDLIFSDIISKGITGDYILINKGKKDGVEKNLPVVTSEKVLCGKIEEVHEDFSKVMLVSNKESIFSAKIEEKEVDSSAKGKGSGDLTLDLIPKKLEIEEGDLVYTSQLGDLYPEGLLVGKISKINSFDLKPYKSAKVDIECEIGFLNNLFILK